MKRTRNTPLSLRLSLELASRLQECAERLKYKKHTLAQDAIEAAVDAIEANDYRLVVPIEFKVARVPVPAYPEHHSQVEDKGPPPPSSLKKAEDKFVAVVKKNYPPKKTPPPA